MANYYDVANVTKCAEVVKVLENNGYNGGELTKKEFDKMFKGSNICSLTWLRESGFSANRPFCVGSIYWWNGGAEPFAKIVRTENIEIVIKDEYAKAKDFLYSNGERIKGINAYEYKHNPTIKALVDKIYENVEVRTECAKTIDAVKHYYSIDLDALRKVVANGSNITREYLTEKLEKAQREVDKIKARIDAL